MEDGNAVVSVIWPEVLNVPAPRRIAGNNWLISGFVAGDGAIGSLETSEHVISTLEPTAGALANVTLPRAS